MRVLAVDYGDARIGMAVSDPTGLICAEAWTLRETDIKKAARVIAGEAVLREAGVIVLGLPKNMNGTEGARAEKSRELKALIETLCGVPVTLWDERLTTVAAHAILRDNGRKTKNHKGAVDAVAASLILDGYLGR